MEKINIILKPVIDLQKTGESIKKLRIKNNFSVHDLQSIFGFEYPQAIYAWEQGKNVPTIDNLLILSRLFKVPVDEIVQYNLVQVSCSCSDYVAQCLNSDSGSCDNCKYKKIA